MEKLLPEVCEVQYGFPFDSKYFSNEKGIPLVRIRDVVRGYSETYTTEEFGIEYQVADGDILVGMDGEFNIARWKGGKAALNQRVCKLIPKEEVDAGYLFYFMPKVLKQIEDETPFVTVKHLSAKKLNAIRILLPSIEKQRIIANELESVDRIIKIRGKQLEKLDELVKARFVEMFDLHPWPQHKAGIFMDDMRNGVSPSNTGTYKAHVLTLSAITQGTFDRNAWKEGDFDCIPSEDKRVSVCDFYMCRGNGNRNLVGSGVYSKENLYDLVFPDTVIAARVDTNMVRLPFLCEAWKRPAIRSQIEAGARTTNGTFKINQKVIANIDISIPPIELQDSFVAFVEQTDKSKVEIGKSLEQLETLKKALMQKYFG